MRLLKIIEATEELCHVLCTLDNLLRFLGVGRLTLAAHAQGNGHRVHRLIYVSVLSKQSFVDLQDLFLEVRLRRLPARRAEEQPGKGITINLDIARELISVLIHCLEVVDEVQTILNSAAMLLDSRAALRRQLTLISELQLFEPFLGELQQGLQVDHVDASRSGRTVRGSFSLPLLLPIRNRIAFHQSLVGDIASNLLEQIYPRRLELLTLL